jgi:ABC-2 type transport system permease protein
MRIALKTIFTIWRRETKIVFRENVQIVGMFAQPILYLLVLGNGISSGVSLNRGGGISYMTFIFPGVIGMSILFTSIFSAMSIIRDRQFGLLKEVLVAPVPRWAVAFGKSLGGATVAMIQATILVFLAPAVGIKLSALILLKLWLLTFLTGVGLTSLGVAIASRMTSLQGFQVVMNFMVMPLYFLSGAMFPLISAPGWMKALAAVDPLTYFVDGLRNILFSNTTMTDGAHAGRSALDVAGSAGLIRWSLTFDLMVVTSVAILLALAAAYRFTNQRE